MRPDRPVVVGHGVVTRLGDRDGPDPPAREGVLLHQGPGQDGRVLGLGYAREKAVPGVGAAHPARSLLPVQRQHVGPQFVRPEGLLEALAQGPRFLDQGRCTCVFAECRRQLRRAALGAVDVGLDLAQRDGSLGEAAVRVKHGVV